MSAQSLRHTTISSAKLLLLVLRHIAAPLVSFVVSYVTAFALVLPLGYIGMSLRAGGGQAIIDILFTAVGYCGVFAGARCLPQVSRRVGSFVLLLLGLIYFCYFVANWGDQMNDEGKAVDMNGLSIVRLGFLAFGGLLATATIWRSSPKKSLQTILRRAVF